MQALETFKCHSHKQGVKPLMSYDTGLKTATSQSIEPLSFGEYINALLANTFQDSSQSLDKEKVFKRYLHFGSLPKTAELESGHEIREYVESRYGSVLLEDIALFKPRTNMQAYLSLLRYLAQNLGMLTSPGSLVSELEKRETSISKNTIAEYLYLAYENNLLCQAKRIDLRTGDFLTRGEKYYLKDLGLKYFLERKVPKEEEYEALIENAVYLELSQRYESVLVGKLGRYTVDFVCSNESNTSNGCVKRHYYQIVCNPFNLSAKSQKIAPLLILKDNYPKTILALEKVQGDCVSGVKCEYVLDWLLG